MGEAIGLEYIKKIFNIRYKIKSYGYNKTKYDSDDGICQYEILSN